MAMGNPQFEMDGGYLHFRRPLYIVYIYIYLSLSMGIWKGKSWNKLVDFPLPSLIFPGGVFSHRGFTNIERQQRQGFDEIQIFGVLRAPSIHENQILRSARGSENQRDEMGWDGFYHRKEVLGMWVYPNHTLIDRKNVNGVSEQSISGLMT